MSNVQTENKKLIIGEMDTFPKILQDIKKGERERKKRIQEMIKIKGKILSDV